MRLYGLKQAPRERGSISEEVEVIVTRFVDDEVIAAKHKKVVNEIFKSIETRISNHKWGSR